MLKQDVSFADPHRHIDAGLIDATPYPQRKKQEEQTGAGAQSNVGEHRCDLFQRPQGIAGTFIVHSVLDEGALFPVHPVDRPNLCDQGIECFLILHLKIRSLIVERTALEK